MLVRERAREDAGSPFVAVRVASKRYHRRTDQRAALRAPTSRSGAGQKGPQNARGRGVTGPKKALAGGVAGLWRGPKKANEKCREKGLEKGPCQKCFRAVSPVPKTPTRAGHGGHNLDSLPVANR